MRCFFHLTIFLNWVVSFFLIDLQKFLSILDTSAWFYIHIYKMQIFVPSLTGVLTSYNVCDRHGRGSDHLRGGRLADSLLLLGPLGSFSVSELHLGFLGWPLAHD